MADNAPEASTETLKFFATDVLFQELIDNVMIDNVATCEPCQDYDTLKSEMDKFQNSTFPMTELLGFKEIEHSLNSIIISIADEQRTASSILGNIVRTKFWSLKPRNRVDEVAIRHPDGLRQSKREDRRSTSDQSKCQQPHCHQRRPR